LLTLERFRNALTAPFDSSLPVVFATLQQITIKFIQAGNLGQRRPPAPPKAPDLVLHAALLVATRRRAELGFEQVVRAKRDEAGRLLSPLAAQNLLHCNFQVVIAQRLKYAAEHLQRPAHAHPETPLAWLAHKLGETLHRYTCCAGRRPVV
jgi:hypothetical protein